MLYQGEDKAVSITVTDINGVAQSIDAMVDLICYLYDVKNETVLIKYRKVATTGYETLIRVSSTVYTIIIPHSLTAVFPLDNLMIEAMIQESDVRFPDGIRRTKGKSKITEIEESLITE
jgi:hypothetical protein